MKIGGYRIRLKNYANLFIPIVFTAVLIYYVAGSWRIIHTDAMLMMRPVGYLMVLSLLFIIKQELVIQKIDDNLSTKKETLFSTKGDRANFIVFALLTFLYTIAFNYAGFTIATLVFPAVAMFFGGIRSIKVLTLVPILLTISVYIAFGVILRVSLPTGILGI